jgi:adenylate cyclase
MNRPLSHLGFQAAQNEAQLASDPPSAEVIQGQLERILGSPQFRDSLRLTRFLTFVVATTLAGKSGCIKAYTIATQALDRDTDFDPQNDPIVRVEAGRLRQALARYYAKDGRDDPVLIDLPRGTYVPSFRPRAGGPSQEGAGRDSGPAGAKTLTRYRDETQQFHQSMREALALSKAQSSQFAELSGAIRSAKETLSQSRDLLKSSAQMLHGQALATAKASAAEAGRPAPVPDRTRQPRGVRPTRQIRNLIAPLTKRMGAKARIFQIAFAAIAVLAILEAAFDIDRPLVGGPNHGLWYKIWPATNAAVRQPLGGEGAPAIYVEPVTAVGQPVEGLFPAKIIRERLIDALARYDDVTVVTEEPDRATRGGAARPEPPRPRAIYRLATTIRYGDDVANLIVQLIDTRDATLVWSRQYDRPVKPHARRPNGSIAPDVARSLLDPFGVIQARERVKLASADPMTDTYRCILDANVYLRSFNPSQYRPVRDCLVQASERPPASITALADLAFVYLRNYRFGVAMAPGDATMLDNAYAMAARAVDIKPDSAFAQYALGAVLLAKGDVAQAKIASEKSYALNPDDGAVAFGRATVLVLTGEVDAGLALLNKNSVKSPNSWIGYHLVMALGSYLKGDLKTAGAASREVANPLFPPGLMLDALIADRAGDRAHAQQDIAMLYQFYPAWRQDFRASVGRYLPEPMADRIAADFKAATADTMQ